MLQPQGRSVSRTWRPMFLWSAAILAFLALAGTVSYVAAEFLRVHRLVRTFPSAYGPQVVEKLGGQEKAAASLAFYLRVPDSIAKYRSGATMLLVWCGPSALPTLVRALKDHDPQVRASAAWAFAGLKTDRGKAAPALAEALADPDEDVRMYSAAALDRMGPAAAPAVPTLIRLLNDMRPPVRDVAAVALGRIGPAAAEAIVGVLVGARHVIPQ